MNSGKVITNNYFHSWTLVSIQLAEALRYLHDDARIIHNDLKTNNVVFQEPHHNNITSNINIQIVIVDFGKACDKDNGKHYCLSFFEKKQYQVNFPHMAPEVIGGLMKQSIFSDMYALGKMIHTIFNQVQVVTAQNVSSVHAVANLCTAEEVKKPLLY